MTKTAKSFKYVMLALAFVLVFVFAFTGCGSGMEKFKDGPKTDDVVTGNGSLAVTKGDYMYFVNGYTSYENTDSSNYDQTVTYGSLYRIKLENGLPAKDYDEEDEDYDGSRSLKNVDVLVKKVVGFEYMGLYIFGDYIYFTSPSTDVDENLDIQHKKVMFFRTKLDRTTAPELIYTTESDGGSVSFNMLANNGNVFLMVLDGTNFKIFNFKKNGGRADESFSNVSSVAFARYETYDSKTPISDFNKDVFYTRTLGDDDKSLSKGNVVCRYNLDECKNYDKVVADNDTTFTFKFASTDNVFYEKVKNSEYLSDNKSEFYASSTIAGLLGDTSLYAITYSDYALIDNFGTNLVLNNGSAIIFNGQTILSGSATIIKVAGGYVYFLDTSANAVKRVSLKADDGEFVTETVAEKAKTTGKNCVSIYDNKLIFLSTDHTNSSVYLHMIDLADSSDHFVGVLEKADYDSTSESD